MGVIYASTFYLFGEGFVGESKVAFARLFDKLETASRTGKIFIDIE